MAKIVSQHIVITINKLAKDDDDSDLVVIQENTIKELEEIVQQLVNDDSVIIEVSSK